MEYSRSDLRESVASSAARALREARDLGVAARLLALRARRDDRLREDLLAPYLRQAALAAVWRARW